MTEDKPFFEGLEEIEALCETINREDKKMVQRINRMATLLMGCTEVTESEARANVMHHTMTIAHGIKSVDTDHMLDAPLVAKIAVDTVEAVIYELTERVEATRVERPEPGRP